MRRETDPWKNISKMDLLSSLFQQAPAEGCTRSSVDSLNELIAAYLSNKYILAFAIFFVAVGLLTLANIVISLIKVALENHFFKSRNGKNLLKFGAGQGKYALITGSTDGIGKEFAVELAKCGFNLVLVSRTLKKLESVRRELLDQFIARDVKIYKLDFSRASNADYDKLKQFIEELPVSVLVNNVGMNHSLPIPFAEETVEVLDNIINVNIGATVKMTHMLLPSMLSERNGLIVNVGSFAGMAHTLFANLFWKQGIFAFLE